VRKDLAVQPRIEAIAAVHGEIVCTNEDLIRNSAYNWSPMSADEISAKTGIEQRRYTFDSLEDLSCGPRGRRWLTLKWVQTRLERFWCAPAPAIG
jgi:hypothetical protein